MQNLAIEVGQTHQYLGAIDWHSFTQLILRPYGYQATPVPPNDAFTEAVGDSMAAAIESVHGTRCVFLTLGRPHYAAVGP